MNLIDIQFDRDRYFKIFINCLNAKTTNTLNSSDCKLLN